MNKPPSIFVEIKKHPGDEFEVSDVIKLPFKSAKLIVDKYTMGDKDRCFLTIHAWYGTGKNARRLVCTADFPGSVLINQTCSSKLNKIN